MLLHIPVSPRGEASFSRSAGLTLLDRLHAMAPRVEVVTRDLAAEPPMHPDHSFVEASLMPAADRSADQVESLGLSETLIGELEAADAVLVTTPMNNFTVPSALKAWIDHVVRPSRTFDISPTGKIGLVPDRPVLAVVACGGRFGDFPGAQEDFFTPYFKYVLGSIGITDVEVLRLEGLGHGPESIPDALGEAGSWLERIVSIER
ncbi:FMN-dependent NADH-azoreductase [Halomonas cupida]|uniref:FMN-dependent NADH-azoreductase n=1 Tax=Halomonas cupida TaxID=44933 RepID=UPI003A92ABA0